MENIEQKLDRIESEILSFQKKVKVNFSAICITIAVIAVLFAIISWSNLEYTSTLGECQSNNQCIKKNNMFNYECVDCKELNLE